MGKKREALYAAILKAVENDLDDEQLHRHIKENINDATEKRIVKALTLAFSDDCLTSEKMIERFGKLAVIYRLKQISTIEYNQSNRIDPTDVIDIDRIEIDTTTAVKKAKRPDSNTKNVAKISRHARSRKELNAV